MASRDQMRLAGLKRVRYKSTVQHLPKKISAACENSSSTAAELLRCVGEPKFTGVTQLEEYKRKRPSVSKPFVAKEQCTGEFATGLQS